MYQNLPLHLNPPNNELLLNFSALFRWARPTSIRGFSWCACVRAYVRACLRVRKLVEANMTMTVKIKVVSLNE